jgi:hypothetical protein
VEFIEVTAWFGREVPPFSPVGCCWGQVAKYGSGSCRDGRFLPCKAAQIFLQADVSVVMATALTVSRAHC